MFRRFSGPAVIAVAAALVSGCGAGTEKEHVTQDIVHRAEADIDLERAKAENQNHLFAEKFRDQIIVLPGRTGMDSVNLLFEQSETLIVSDLRESSQLRAASIAVAQRTPMILFDGANRPEILTIANRLGVNRLLVVGDVPLAAQDGTMQVMHDSGTNKGMGTLTAFQFNTEVVARPEQMVEAVAGIGPDSRIELKAAWEPLERREEFDDSPYLKALPQQSRRDSSTAPIFVATSESSIAAVANARAFGGSVRVMPDADPRSSKAAYAMVAGLENGALVALGNKFGEPHIIRDRIIQGWPPVEE